jgi:hypothetical protein
MYSVSYEGRRNRPRIVEISVEIIFRSNLLQDFFA